MTPRWELFLIIQRFEERLDLRKLTAQLANTLVLHRAALTGDIRGLRIGVVRARWNEPIVDRLQAGVDRGLAQLGVRTVIERWVPGSFEIPLLAHRLAGSGRYAAVICLGAVIRGGTDHYQYIASEVAKGVGRISAETGIPTVFGVLTTDTVEQAVERAGTKAGNKGFDAALAALELAGLMERL